MGRQVLFLAICVVVMKAAAEAATCPPLTSSTVIIKCFLKTGKSMIMVDCKKPMQPKTTAVFQCPDNFKISENYQKVKCMPNGKWENAVVTCAAAGEVTVTSTEAQDQINQPQSSTEVGPQTNVQSNDGDAIQSSGDLSGLRVSKQPVFLVQALSECEAANGSLLVADSSKKIDVLNALFAKPASFAGATNDQKIWTGVMMDVNSVWSVISDEEAPTNVNDMPSFKWADGCPKPGDKNRCTVFQKKAQAHCNIACDILQKQPYICVPPPPSS